MYFISGDCTRFLVRSVWVTGPWNYRCMLMYFPGGKEPAGISGATFLIEMSWRKVLLASERFGLHMVRYRALSVHLNFGTNLIIYTHTAQNIFTYLYTTHGKWNIEIVLFWKGQLVQIWLNIWHLQCCHSKLVLQAISERQRQSSQAGCVPSAV